MAEAPVELLQRVPLFADFEGGELERLARSFKERTFEAGSNVVDEGKTGAGFFVIESGEAPLDEALKLWERGEELYRFCKERLDTAEGKIEELASRAEAAKP